MKKEDYMHLPKERLAEMLEERDEQIPAPVVPNPILIQGYPPKCYEPGGTCTNPFRDCINCPRTFTNGQWSIGTSTCDKTE